MDARKKGRAYSKGNRQKVALVAALASDVELLVFDEPTSGLDPLMAEVFQQCVAEARQAGRSVLLASHILAEVERLCDRISIVRAGRNVRTGTLGELRRLSRTTVRAELDRAPDSLAGLPGVYELRIEGGRVSCRVDTEALGPVLRQLAECGIRDLVSQPPALEELFLRHYEADPPPRSTASGRSPASAGSDRR